MYGIFLYLSGSFSIWFFQIAIRMLIFSGIYRVFTISYSHMVHVFCDGD